MPLDWRTYLSPSFTTVPVMGWLCAEEEACEDVFAEGWLDCGADWSCCWAKLMVDMANASAKVARVIACFINFSPLESNLGEVLRESVQMSCQLKHAVFSTE